jgi:hypothetical protein
VIQTQTKLPIKLDARAKTTDRAGLREQIGDLEDWEIERYRAAGLLPAINIASRDSKREELRFPRICLDALLAHLSERAAGILPAGGEGGSLFRPSTADLCRSLFGPRPADGLVRLTLNCQSWHLYNLTREGSLPIAPQSSHHQGRGGSGLVRWESLLKFIESRMV